MTRTLTTLLGALLFAGATALNAQTPPAEAGKGERPRQMRDCSKAPDPTACEERRQKMRSALDEAKKACDGKKGKERHECMAKSVCAKAPDPAKCEARAKERSEKRMKTMEERKAMREAKKASAPKN